MEIWLTAITLGFLGSLHCAGMCGPIALSLPVVSNTRFSRITGILLYNAGRALTYGLLGGLFGLMGKSFIIAGYQQALSITMGASILAIVILPGRYWRRFKFTHELFQPVLKLKTALDNLFKTRSYSSLLTIGILNGLLPCGLVYLGVAGAIATSEPLKGTLFMIFFGLGTMPAMLGLTLTGQKISLELRNNFRKVVPLFVSVMAVLLILRGLNLGIPYVSPELSKSDCTKHQCCKK